MLEPKVFLELLHKNGFSSFSGVPDSLLKELCACITDTCAAEDHLVTANEGAAIALASGYHLATGKAGVVYMQNSGTGNAVNPLLSLADPAVYAVPMLLIIGWRGEPGVHDEPQHITQGRLQEQLLDALELPYEVLGDNMETAEEQLRRLTGHMWRRSGPVALLVRKNTFEKYSAQEKAAGRAPQMNREQALEIVLDHLCEDDRIISTTGKTSREIYELREARAQGHARDFLTVGSMGHTSMIALGLVRSLAGESSGKVVCLDGDGAALMHMGSMAIIARRSPKNYFHIVLNNGSHDSVGGQETIGFEISFADIAGAMGYAHTGTAETTQELSEALHRLHDADGPVLLEIRVRKGARSDLGRPRTSPLENKRALMNNLHGPQKKYIGRGAISQLGTYLSACGAKKVLVFHGRKSYRASGAEKLVERLEADMRVECIADIPENPELNLIKKLTMRYHDFGPDALLAIGGGSVIDTAKACLAMAGGSSEEEIFSNQFRLPEPRPLFIAIPTTAGSGSEATHFAVLYKAGKKYSLAAEGLRPDTVVLDPEAILGCPLKTSLASGMDAVCQAVESFWSKNANEKSRGFSLKALSLLLPSVLKAADTPDDIQARSDMLEGAHTAGQAIDITKTTAGHALSYSLTSNYGLPH